MPGISGKLFGSRSKVLQCHFRLATISLQITSSIQRLANMLIHQRSIFSERSTASRSFLTKSHSAEHIYGMITSRSLCHRRNRRSFVNKPLNHGEHGFLRTHAEICWLLLPWLLHVLLSSDTAGRSWISGTVRFPVFGCRIPGFLMLSNRQFRS